MGSSITLVQERNIKDTGYQVVSTMTVADPIPLRKCVLVAPLTDTQEERFVRVSTLQDLEQYETTMQYINRFYVEGNETEQTDFESDLDADIIQADDLLIITPVPDDWLHDGYVEANATYQISYVSKSPYYIILIGNMPRSVRGLGWQLKTLGGIEKASGTEYGVSCRQSTIDGDTEYVRENEFIYLAENITDGVNHMEVVRAQTQALVDESNTDTDDFSGTDTIVYT